MPLPSFCCLFTVGPNLLVTIMTQGCKFSCQQCFHNHFVKLQRYPKNKWNTGKWKNQNLTWSTQVRAKFPMSFQVILFLLVTKAKGNNARNPTVPFDTTYLLSLSGHEKRKLFNFLGTLKHWNELWASARINELLQDSRYSTKIINYNSQTRWQLCQGIQITEPG